jgi:hypothetical protein
LANYAQRLYQWYNCDRKHKFGPWLTALREGIVFIAEYYAAAFVNEKERQFRSQRFAQRSAYLQEQRQQAKAGAGR